MNYQSQSQIKVKHFRTSSKDDESAYNAWSSNT